MEWLWGGIIGLVNGFLASGGGIAAVLILERRLKIETKKAHATAIAVILPLSAASVLVYGISGYTDAAPAIKAAAGGIVGAVIGAKILNNLPKKYIKIGFGAVMLIAAWQMFVK